MSAGLDVGAFILIAGVIVVVWASGVLAGRADRRREPFFDVEVERDGWSWEDALDEIRELPEVHA